ncbi:MAG: T9SS type A sorting domain-containing protein, partial [Cyclobacteriaceae bacterium]|nr:T9SS type A sorting domain-containing protein [Cyclobacteriaceae bacterium]
SCSVWQEDINDWLNQCRNEHYYDDNGNNTLTYQKIWEISINDWIIWSYFEREYNENEEQVLSTRYMYDSLIGDYILHSKTEYFQAQNENSFIDYTWDINSNDWIYSSKYQRFYDENGNLIMRYHYNFDLQNNNWNLISQADYEYDENANILLYTSRSWDEQDKITYSIMEESHYKENGNLRYKIIYSWNDEISEWQLDRKNFYYYSTVITSAKKAYNSSIIVYPNPSNSVLNISGEDAKDAWIKIYSASGKFVESHFIKNNQLDISGLNPGIYFITIDDHIKEKFIKK